MGAWGVKLYDNDTALDVKDEYIDLLKRGKTNQQVTNRLINEYEDILSDEEEAEAAEFWFVLADMQWKYGRLLPFVKEKALEYLDKDEHLLLWKEAGEKEYEARIKVLEDLKAQLLSIMPPEKKVSKYRLYKCKWNIGDVFAYQFTSEHSKEKGLYGKYILLRKVDEDIWWPGHVVPIVHVYKWVGKELPNIGIIDELPYLPQTGTPEYVDINNQKMMYGLELLSTSKRVIPDDNLFYLGNVKDVSPPKNENKATYYACKWRDFEEHVILFYLSWEKINI